VFVSLPSPDWNISISTGDIEYVPGLEQYDVVVLGSGVTGYAYFYYGGIISEAQKVVNGDSLLPVKYPGLKAVGTQVLVRAPAVQTVLVSVAVIASAGVSVSSLIDPVKQAVIAYVNSRKVGEDLSVLRIGAAALGVSGVEDAAVLVPTGNVSVPDGYVAKTSISYITVS
jgi:hypothetical protein